MLARTYPLARSFHRSFSNSSLLAKDRLIIFDTTLRDGEQSPGATLTTDEKLKIALQLSNMGVDVCEAGFPIASPGDFEAVSRIAKEIGPMVGARPSGLPMRICGLSRANDKDIRRCYNAIKHAPLHRIHTFLATSDIHLEHKLNMTRSQCIDKCVESVLYAKSLLGDGGDIEFSPEDAGRSDKDFLCDVLAAVIEAGAVSRCCVTSVVVKKKRALGKIPSFVCLTLVFLYPWTHTDDLEHSRHRRLHGTKGIRRHV